MFKSRKVYLRPVEKGDMESFYKAVQNEDIRYMTGTTREYTMEDLYEHYERITSDETRYDFAVCLKEDDRLIGDLSIMDIDRRNRKAGFRIALHSPAYLNKGYGIEAVRLAMQLAFERLDLNPLQLEVFSHNIRALKAYEKAGFKMEGRIREALYMNEQYRMKSLWGY